MTLVPRKAVLRALSILCVLGAGALKGFSLDREAFSIAQYDLNVQVDAAQHRLAVRGKVALRNDTSSPQKIAVLQISSSLEWRSIRAGDKPVQFLRQPLTSDIDHTGSLSEAVVTLPQDVAPHGTVDLDVGYEGVVVLDATRLTRIGAPEDFAKNTDWDQIDSAFTGVRGIGHVAWYPVATDVANLSELDSLPQVLERWKARETGATAHVKIDVVRESAEEVPTLVTEPSCSMMYGQMSRIQPMTADCIFRSPGTLAPSIVIGQFGTVTRPSIIVYNLPTHALAAEAFADAAEKIVPLITDWFGSPREKALTADLPDSNDAPFESGALLLTPLAVADSKLAGLAAAHQLEHASFSSLRPWIDEGLAHFAQALYLEQQKGRQSALEYMGTHRSALDDVETSDTPEAQHEVNHSLVNTTNEALLRSKAMCVWWMLRDMLGDATLKKAFAAYKPGDDKDPSYMPRLISTQTQRDLEWFFEDWVYRDHGLPEFKVESAFVRKTVNGGIILSVTVENLGTAGAEVPVVIKMAHGELSKRIEVRAKSKTTVRVETPATPLEILVNDGSVPERNMKNNTFKVNVPQS